MYHYSWTELITASGKKKYQKILKAYRSFWKEARAKWMVKAVTRLHECNDDNRKKKIEKTSSSRQTASYLFSTLHAVKCRSCVQGCSVPSGSWRMWICTLGTTSGGRTRKRSGAIIKGPECVLKTLWHVSVIKLVFYYTWLLALGCI